MRVARAREKSASFFYFYRKMAGSHISSYSPAKLSPNKAKTSKRNRLKKTNKKRRRRQRVYIYGRKSVRSTYAICKKRSNMKKERRQKKKWKKFIAALRFEVSFLRLFLLNAIYIYLVSNKSWTKEKIFPVSFRSFGRCSTTSFAYMRIKWELQERIVSSF